jgi:hypothetical protein
MLLSKFPPSKKLFTVVCLPPMNGSILAAILAAKG